MAGRGNVTGCDLSDVTPLCMPWISVNGQRQPGFSRPAALLSLELAASAYDLALDAWREAGWHDISYQVDNALFSAVVGKKEDRDPETDLAERFQRQAQARLKRLNPISQLRGTLRQREGSDTCKAVVMLHRALGDRYVVAIGFMGTGKRIYDWISNFRMSQNEGMHNGFLQLTQRFENSCDQILFPETAKDLGLSRLSLSDILAECRRPQSRFRIWMAGHSQGGAVMQLFAYRQVRQGLLRQHMLGYGFASPSAMYRHPACDPGSFPLFHIINADDAVPRVGAQLHLGRCRVFFPDSAMREACYGQAWQDPAFRAVLSLTRTIRDNDSAMLLFLALLRTLTKMPGEDAAAVLNSLMGKIMPDFLLGMLSGKMDDMLSLLIRKTEQGYAQASGSGLPEGQLQPLCRRMERLVRQFGTMTFAKAVGHALGLPHKLRGTNAADGMAPYQYLVTQRFQDLRHRVWCASTITSCASERAANRRLPAGRYAAFSAARNRRSHRVWAGRS